MTSADPLDWDKAWNEYLEPLNQLYPDNPYQEKVEGFRQQRDDRHALRRALDGIKQTGAASEAQRFYQKGLRLCREGDPDGARRIWQNLVSAFREVESESRWVHLAERGLAELGKAAPVEENDSETVEAALERARKLRDENKRPEAETIWQGLEALYRDDASAGNILKRIDRDRQK